MVTFQDKVAVLNQPGFDKAIHALFDALIGEDFGKDMTGSDAEIAQSDPKRFLSARGVEISDELQVKSMNLKAPDAIEQIECIGDICACVSRGGWKVCL
jgi:hypothetical protein